MREYRGKRINTGEWVYGSLVETEGHCFIHNGSYNVDSETWGLRIGYFKGVIPETVGQYTGLSDKDGTKIFEGDMVKYSGNTLILYEVVVSDGAFVLQSIPDGITTSFRTLIRGDGATSADFAVIGNIHGAAVTQ